MDTGGGLERQAARATRLVDGVLDFVLLAFAAWTVVYHACLVLRVGTTGAAIAWALLLAPCAWLASRRPQAPRSSPPAERPPWPRRRLAQVLGGYALAAVGSAAVYSFASPGWALVWLLLAACAAAAVVLALLRAQGRVRLPGDEEPEDESAPRALPGALVALGWALALATLSLFLVRPDSDDTQYVRLSTWIAERGEFPLRDVLFSDQAFPATFYPPLSSFEALVGVVAQGAGASAPAVTYLLVPPLASALSVLAGWRLLREWKVRSAGLALSTSLVFLLMAAQDHRTLGNLFVGRIWQGKIVFLAVLVPLLLVLLLEYARRPTRRGLVLLAAGGAAGVGLTSTGTFLVPVLAAGCLAPLALRAAKPALAGFAATAAYPLGALAVAAAVGSRRAGTDVSSDVVTGEIARLVLGSGLFAFVGVVAMLLGPLLLASRRGALAVSAVVLLVLALYAPPVPPLIWELTGIGRVLWRLVWIVPIAALVGSAATALLPRGLPPLARAAPAALLCGLLVAWGSPVWDAGDMARRPAWKREAAQITAARQILARTGDGDLVLAPAQLSQTLLLMSADVTTVAPRPFYVLPLADVPAAHAEERLLLQALLEPTLGASLPGWPARPPGRAQTADLLRTVGVDLACVPDRRPAALKAVEGAGYSRAFTVKGQTCLRPPDGASR